MIHVSRPPRPRDVLRVGAGVPNRPGWARPSGSRASALFALLVLAAGTLHSQRDRSSGPTVESIWPQPAAVGELVTIQAHDAGSRLDALTVRFGEQPAQILDLVGDRILVRVPRVDDVSGVSIQRDRRRGQSVPFQVRPTPYVVPAGAGSAQATLQFVVVGSQAPTPVEVTSLDPERPELVALPGSTFPASAGAGSTAVLSFTVGGSNNVGRFATTGASAEPPPLHVRVQPDAADLGCQPDPTPIPELWEIVPFRAAGGEPVRIRGRGFGGPDAEGPLEVEVGGTPATVLQRTETELIVIVPESATAGDVEVIRDGAVSNALPMQVLPRLLLSADDLQLERGQTATITARLTGTKEATELTAALLTPGVALMEDGGRSGVFTTSGGEQNLVRFRVRGVREGRFELLASAFPEPGQTSVIQSGSGPEVDSPSSATGGTRLGPGKHPWSDFDLEAWDWSGTRSSQPAEELLWDLVPPSLGTVTADGIEIEQSGQGSTCGVAIGRDPESPGAIPITIPISDAVADPLGGLLFQQAPEDPPAARGGGCDWRKICIDVFVMAHRQGDRATLGQVLEPHRETISGFRSREVTVPARAFTAAGGALADVTELPDAAQLVDNIRSMLRRISGIYAECCVWFELGHVYAVDPTRARVATDVRLDSWVRGGDDPEMHVGREVRAGGRELTFLDGARAFVDDHSGLEANQCLKIFVGRGFTGSGDEAGVANAPGAYAAFDLSRLSPRASPFVAAHEIGHCLMGEGHWDRQQDQGARRFNCMERQEPSLRHSDRDLFLDEQTQCPKVQRRAREIGVAEEPPRPAPAPPTNPEPTDAEPPPEGSSTPADPGPDAEPRPPTPSEPDAPEEESDDEDEACPCPEPQLAVTGLEEANRLRDGRSATVVATFTTCCATVRLTAEVERVRVGTYDVTWSLQIEKTSEECFVDFVLDRYFNSKALPFVVGGGTAGQAVQATELELRSLGDGRYELRGDGGYQLDYGPFGGSLSERNLDPNGDTSLNRLESARSWLLVLGGVVRCRRQQETVEFPFHFRFQKDSRSDIELDLRSTTLDREQAPRQARPRMTTSPLARLP